MNLTRNRHGLLAFTALTVANLGATTASAQGAAEDYSGLDVIVVTAQKREQNLQDVPIAVTALGGNALVANRVATLQDLSGLAPGVTVTMNPGPTKTPQFSMRGVVSSGGVPGSEKQVSTYFDGVYLASPRGSVFDLPDIERIEVLRGPQGTLFGRNATAGAVSVATRNPTGEVGVRALITAGNRDHYRFQTSVDLPQMGPFSAYMSYVHNYLRGPIRNLAAGRILDFRNSQDKKSARIFRSPEYLGTTDSDSFFAALKFESGDFVTTYKFDKFRDRGTMQPTALVGYDTNVALLHRLITTQAVPVPIASDGKRPDVVSNGWITPTIQDNSGHNLTSTYQFSDSLSVKNVFAFRKSYIFGANPLDGVSSLIITPQVAQLIPAFAPLVGQPFLGIANNAQSRNEQISDEFQINYNSDFLTATVGALWFESKDWVGEQLVSGTPSFTPVPGGKVPNATIGKTYNKGFSIAAYTQLEFHLSPQLDVILGGRITRDKKSGTLTYGPNLNALAVLPFRYQNSKPNYLIGVNYNPTDDILLYGKYSTAYVSGGSVVGIQFAPETVKSWEAGVKVELLDRKLRANLALFHAKYSHAQGATSNVVPGACDFIFEQTGDPNRCTIASTFINDLGDIRSRGFEIDVDAAPVRGVTLGGNLGYTDTKLTRVNPLLVNSAPGRVYKLVNRPKWVGSAWAQYETPPLVDEAYLSFRGDGRYQSRIGNATTPLTPSYQTWAAGVFDTPGYWIFNARVALKDLDVRGIDTELALWGRNLTDNRAKAAGLNLGVAAAANYIPARTYGLDLAVKF